MMKNSSKTFNILLTLFVFGFVIWFGGTILRTTIAYDIFVPGAEMELKAEYSNAERMQTIYIFSITSLLTGISYGVAAVSSIILAILSRKEFKQKGWLFMAFCLFVLTIPIQAYFLHLDYVLANAVYYEKVTDFYNPIIQEYFVERFTDVKNASLYSISLLASLTCVLYAIWRPLEKKDNLEKM